MIYDTIVVCCVFYWIVFKFYRLEKKMGFKLIRSCLLCNGFNNKHVPFKLRIFHWIETFNGQQSSSSHKYWIDSLFFSHPLIRNTVIIVSMQWRCSTHRNANWRKQMKIHTHRVPKQRVFDEHSCLCKMVLFVEKTQETLNKECSMLTQLHTIACAT